MFMPFLIAADADDPPPPAQVHPDKCSHPHATAAFEVLGHANQQLQSEEVMHELRHVLTLARGAPPLPQPFPGSCGQHGISAVRKTGQEALLSTVLSAAVLCCKGPACCLHGPCVSEGVAGVCGAVRCCDRVSP